MQATEPITATAIETTHEGLVLVLGDRRVLNAADPRIKCWENRRRGEIRICLWLECENYLVVLAKRRRYFLLWTAYLVTSEHQKRKLLNKYEMFHKH